MARRVPILALVLLAASALGATGARAAWIEPAQISDTGFAASQPQIAVDAAGDAIAVWTVGSEPNRGIRSAAHPAGGSWESPSAAVLDAHDCHDARLAMDSSGRAVAIAECQKPSPAIWAAYREGGHWNPAGEVPGSANGKGVRVAIDPAGNAVAVWATGTVIHSAYRARLGSWVLDSGQLSTSGKQALDPNVAMSPGGYAFTVWREKRENTVSDPVIAVKSNQRLGAAAWNGPLQLTQDFGSGAVVPVAEGEPQIVADAGGGRMAAWIEGPSMAERTAPCSTCGYVPSTSLNEATRFVEVPKIALDGQTRAIAAFRSFKSGEFLVKGSTTAFSSGPWSSPVTLGVANGIATVPAVAADPAGDATLAFNFSGTVSASSRPAGGAVPAPVTISNASHVAAGDAQVAMADAGDALVAWASPSTSPQHLAVAVNDVTPPAFAAITTPSSADSGIATQMSASAIDAWSSSTITWDFGDGATATGTSVSHSYATEGKKTITVTATDAVGNSSSETREIQVNPAGSGNQGGNPAGGKNDKKKLALTATVVKQPWKKILKAKAIKLRCGLDATGTCAVKASVGAAVARRIGLKAGKRAKSIGVGSGSAQVARGEVAVVKVRLTGKARAAIDAATKPVPIALAVTGSAAGRQSATLSAKLKIKRP